MTELLAIRDLSIEFATPRGVVQGLRQVNLTIARGETVAIVGESGSGKSTLAYAVMRYMASNARQSAGEILFEGRSIADFSEKELRAIRGADVSVVFQDPATSFNPTMTVGSQVEETIQQHTPMTRARCRRHAVELLARAGLTDPDAAMEKFPHQMSGGEKQRALIAAALVNEPKLLIMDEPTTALDVTTATGLVALLQELKERLGIALLYITHDLSIMAQIADRAYLLEKGRVVEEGAVEQIVLSPREPYTQKLLASVPQPDVEHRAEPVQSQAPLLETKDLQVTYEIRLPGGLLARSRTRIKAVSGVSLRIGKGETVGLIGESGCGKSSIARSLMGLSDFEGQVVLDGRVYRGARSIDMSYRRSVQMVFQHPDLSLNPRLKIRELIARPLRVIGGMSAAEIGARVAEMARKVQLPESALEGYTHQLSGGQKQRVAIARAFVTQPELVICDEITSGLDVTVQKAIMDLLAELQAEYGTSYLFITHDINLIRSTAHRLYTMYFGHIVEHRDLSRTPASAMMHPYSEVLVNGALPPAAALHAHPIPITGEVPSRLAPPTGCDFASRCPRRIGAICDQEKPRLVACAPGSEISCHLVDKALAHRA